MRLLRNKIFNDTALFKIFIAFLVFISRFGVFPPNFSALGSFGFLSKSPIIFFSGIVLFDIVYSGFYSGFVFTYIGFASYYLLGFVAKNNIKLQMMLLPIASFLFFLFSNFGSFLSLYPHTLQGLFNCYIAGLPFFVNTLSSDLVFTYGFLFAFRIYKSYTKEQNIISNVV